MPPIDPETSLATVHLTVSDLERSREFYEQILGMRSAERDDGTVEMTAGADGPALLELRGDRAAEPRNPRLTGLFHFAVLVPTRRDLAVALLRIAQAQWPLSGASDHLVSEALYLNDPDGNGIEIYRDRPRSEWTRDEGGQLRMATLPLDLDDLIAELHDAPPDPERDALLAPGTRIGHVHLQVSELAETEAFYNGILGFDVVVRGYPGALFVSAGGYHHHIGLNTWNSRDAGAPPSGAVGLRSFQVQLPGAPALEAVLARISAAGLPTESAHGGTIVRDPSGNAVLLRAASA